MYVCMYVCMYICMYVCIFVCMYLYIYVPVPVPVPVPVGVPANWTFNNQPGQLAAKSAGQLPVHSVSHPVSQTDRQTATVPHITLCMTLFLQFDLCDPKNCRSPPHACFWN